MRKTHARPLGPAMNAFHTPESTMTPHEAEAVVRRYLERTADAPAGASLSGPSVADVAEALRASPEEIARLLAEVRAAPRTKPPCPTTRRERRVWLLSGALALVLGGTAVGAMRLAEAGPFARDENPASSLSSGSFVPYTVRIDGQNQGFVRYDDHQGPPSVEIPSLVERWFRAHGPSIAPPRRYSAESAQAGVQAARDGRWDAIQGVRMVEFELRKPGERGEMRWAQAVVPLYDGDDSLLWDAVARERKRRLDAAIATALEGVAEVPAP